MSFYRAYFWRKKVSVHTAMSAVLQVLRRNKKRQYILRDKIRFARAVGISALRGMRCGELFAALKGFLRLPFKRASLSQKYLCSF